MGYSARYHTASLVAVFLALAIGILIGVGFGGDVIEGTTEELEQSLREELDEAEAQVADLGDELAREREFSEAVHPALVGDLLRNHTVGVLALGGLPEEVRGDVQAALQGTGAELVAFAVVREPPDLQALAGAVPDGRFRGLRRGGEPLEDLARALGRDFVRGGDLFEDMREVLLDGFSGETRPLDGVIVVREPSEELEPRESEATERLETGLLEALRETKAEVVGVERTDAEESSIAVFQDAGLSSVDDVDLVAGRVAMVLALRGAEGSFGVKDTADQLLPDLLLPRPATPR